MHDCLCSIKKIDNLGRIVIPKEICKIAKIKKNDELKIMYDELNQVLLLKKNNMKSIINIFVDEVFNPFYETFKTSIIITDKEKIVEILSSKKNKLQNLKKQKISKELLNMILDSNLSIARMNDLKITDSFAINKKFYYFPLKKDYYTIGSAIIIIDKKIDADFLDFISTKLSI